MSKRIVVISDLQIPYHHKGAVEHLIRFVEAIKPDALACVGDELDAPMVSKYDENSRGEYSRRLQADIDDTHAVLAAFRRAMPEGEFWLQRSNHTDRLERYIEKKAPAIASLRGLTYPELMRTNDLGITYNKKLTEITPGVLLGHGDEYGLSGISGMTAHKLMEATGKSVVIGHTHRLGLVWASKGYSGRVTSRFGLEVGNLMNMASAGYLKPRGAANWQMGFGVLDIDGKSVQPYAVAMRPDGSFTFEGKNF
jgi:predicted phosphodiesterase